MFLKSPSVLFLSFCFLSIASIHAQFKLVPGKWKGELSLNDSTTLPFRMQIEKEKNEYSFAIQNAEETIVLTKPILENDSITIAFPNFNSALRFKISNKKMLLGYWTNFNKGNNYKIPFKAIYTSKTESKSGNNHDFTGKWKTTFDVGTQDAYMAIGIFKTVDNKIYGTFQTETGDYRFLEGKVDGKSFNLSCFDGSHAFHFTGKLENNQINGRFFSGKHGTENWIAVQDSTFKLTNPDSLTYVVKSEPFTFKLKDLAGNDFVYPNAVFQNKVTVVQIMGTWCPNCMDETEYFKELYANYHDRGLEIIAVGYEIPKEFSEQVAKIKLLQQRHQLPFHFLVGGTASKSLASEQFSMLNKIISYPTAIIIGKDGEVKKVHTGFNGPGTGQIYLDYVKETNAFIEELLK